MRTPAAATAPVQRRVHIDALPRTVFELLTDADKLVWWMGIDAELEPRPGGIYRVNVTGHETVRGEFCEVVPCSRLVFTWGWEEDAFPVAPGASTVEITLEPVGGGTLLCLEHRDLPSEMLAFHATGWEHVLARLAAVASGGDPGRDALTSSTRVLRLMAGALPRRYVPRLLLSRFAAATTRRRR